MGTEALRKMQYGLETTHGTAVAATKMLPIAVPPILPDREPTFPRENAGVLADAQRAYVSGRKVADSLKFDTAYFQLLPMLFSCGVKGNITPVEQTADQDDWLWDHTPSLDGTDNEIDSITLERGDDTFMVETEYVMFDRIKISGDINQDGRDSTVKIEANYFGRQNTATAFTALTPQVSLVPMNAKLARFYLDTTWAGVGGTEKTNTLRAFDIEIMGGAHPKFHGSGNEFFDEHGQGSIGVMAAFTFEGNSNMAAILTAMNAASLQVARLDINGPQIGSGDNYLFRMDLSGAWKDVIALASSSNGNNLWTAMLQGYYDPTGTKMVALSAITNHATI